MLDRMLIKRLMYRLVDILPPLQYKPITPLCTYDSKTCSDHRVNVQMRNGLAPNELDHLRFYCVVAVLFFFIFVSFVDLILCCVFALCFVRYTIFKV